jgi:ribonuclease HII
LSRHRGKRGTPDEAGRSGKSGKEFIHRIESALRVGDVALATSLLSELREIVRRDRAAALRALERRARALIEDRERFDRRAEFERPVRQKGYSAIAGVDEAGRGPLAGPVVAAAVILPPGVYVPGLDDSKRLTPGARERAFGLVLENAVGWAIGVCTVEEIDRHNIYRATIIAMRKAILALGVKPDYVISDAVRIPDIPVPQWPVVKGDALSNCVAAASVVAKVTRDRMMMEIDREFPAYGFRRHKGYATPEHLGALRRFGPCPYHRSSFDWGRDAANVQMELPCEGEGDPGCLPRTGGE